MAELSPFARDLGVSQGRIKPTRWTPRQGEYVFCLGSDIPGRTAMLVDGDGVSIVQDSPLGVGTTFIRPFAHLRPPTTVPVGTSWRFQARVESVPVAEVVLERERDLSDVYFPVSHLLAAQLEFVLLFDGPPATRHEAELPAVYIDGLAIDTGVGPVVVNRLPAPGERGVPPASVIQLDICDTTSAGIDLGATTISVNGIPAVAAGTFEPGWDGPSSSTATRDGDRTTRVVIEPTTPFDSDTLVVVRVVSQTTDGRPLDVTYSFTIGDTAAPLIVAATSPDEDLVRVEFAEPVRQLDAAPADDALNPTNWAVVLVQGPPAANPYRDGAGVWVEVESVRSVSATTVELVTDIPMTAGATYRVVATGVADVSGNAVAVPNNSAIFTAFDDAPAERRRLITLPRFNLDHDATGDLRRFLWCLQEPLNLLFRRVDRWTDILDPDIAPEPYLDAMLEELGNPFTFSLSADDKRRLIRILVSIYKAKGTAQGIVDAIRFFLGLEVTITYPCFRGVRLGRARIGSTFILAGAARDHYAYDIVPEGALTAEQRARVVEIAEYMQVAHEHLRFITEPAPPPPVLNHLVLGRSRLGVTWKLH